MTLVIYDYVTVFLFYQCAREQIGLWDSSVCIVLERWSCVIVMCVQCGICFFCGFRYNGTIIFTAVRI